MKKSSPWEKILSILQMSQLNSLFVQSLTSPAATITSLSAPTATISLLNAPAANIGAVTVGNLTANVLNAQTANLTQISAPLGNLGLMNIQNLYAQYANIPTLAVGNLTGGGGGALTVGQILAQNLTANVSSLGNVQGPLTVSGDIIFTGNLRQTLFSNSGATGPLNYTFGNLAAANLVTTNANVGTLGAGTIFCSNIVGYSASAVANIPANLTLTTLNVNQIFASNVVQANAFRINNTNTYLTSGPGGSSANDYLQINGFSGTGIVVGSSSMVGINTTTPAYPLDVAGGLRATLITTSNGASLNAANASFNCMTAATPSGLTVTQYNGNGPTINMNPTAGYSALTMNYGGRGGGPYASLAALDDTNFSSHLTLNTATPGNPNNTVSERVRVTSAGLVGVGTATPNSTLDVAGNIRATTTTSTYSTALRLESLATSAVGATLDMASQYTSISQPNKICARQWAEADNLSGGRWVLQTSNTGGTLITGASLNAAGNFGLGNVSAGAALYPLDVGGSCRVQGQYIVGNVVDTAGANASIVQRVQNTSVVLAPQPTNTTSANGSCSNYHYTDYNYPNLTAPFPSGRCFVLDSNYGTDFRWQSKLPGTATNSLVERFTITAGGNVGISNPFPTCALDVAGPIRLTTALRFVNTNTTVAPGPGGTAANDYLQITGGSLSPGVAVNYQSLVGIGTTNPAYQLDVAGNTRITGNFTVATSPAITYMLRGIVTVPVNPTLTSQGDYQVGITYGQNLPDLNYIITATVVSTNNYSDWYTASITNKSINGATCNMARLTNVGGSGANVATTTWGDGGLQVNWIVMR